MTSYQKRKQDIKFQEQCVKELEDIAIDLAKQLKVNNITPKLPLGGSRGIASDDYLTDYNSGDFRFKLL